MLRTLVAFALLGPVVATFATEASGEPGFEYPVAIKAFDPSSDYDALKITCMPAPYPRGQAPRVNCNLDAIQIAIDEASGERRCAVRVFRHDETLARTGPNEWGATIGPGAPCGTTRVLSLWRDKVGSWHYRQLRNNPETLPRACEPATPGVSIAEWVEDHRKRRLRCDYIE